MKHILEAPKMNLNDGALGSNIMLFEAGHELFQLFANLERLPLDDITN